MRNLASVLLLALLTVEVLSGQTREVSSEEAARHSIKRVRAVYPEMAQIAHILGDVTVRFTISENGDVTDVQPLSGHPLLMEAAQAAIRQWRYIPFEVSGRRTAVVTSVVIAFPAGLPVTPEEQVKRKVLDRFYSDLLICTQLVETSQFAKAEPFCRRALAVSSTLDPPQPLFRMDACKYMGHLLSYQGKGAEALQNYQEELSIAQKTRESHQDELAEAYVNVGNAKRDLADPKSALEHYQRAESIYRQIANNPASQSEKNRNSYAFWRVLRNHAEVLLQIGQPAAAASLEREAAGIVVEEGAPQ